MPLTRARRAAPEMREGAILDAALSEFAAFGFVDARMEDIARGAGVSKGTLYLYYAGKEALFEALVRRDIGPKVAMVAGLLDHYEGALEPVLTRMVEAVSALIDSGDLPIYPRLLVAEAGRFPDLVRFYRREVVGVMIGALSGLFRRAMDQGEIAPDDPDIIAHLFIGPVLKAMLWALVFTPTEDTPFRAGPYLAAHVRVFLKGIA